jgi:hypothetical protein
MFTFWVETDMLEILLSFTIKKIKDNPGISQKLHTITRLTIKHM